MQILQTRAFIKIKNRLHKNQISSLDKAIQTIITNPLIGKLKKGDLQGIRIYKYKSQNQLFLIGYSCSPTHIMLKYMGSHGNFYRDLKRIY